MLYQINNLSFVSIFSAVVQVHVEERRTGIGHKQRTV